MFIKQVLIPVLIMVFTCIWAGMQIERIRWEVREKRKKRPAIRHMPKKYNWKVDEKV